MGQRRLGPSLAVVAVLSPPSLQARSWRRSDVERRRSSASGRSGAASAAARTAAKWSRRRAAVTSVNRRAS
jgi:hypothetical protein